MAIFYKLNGITSDENGTNLDMDYFVYEDKGYHDYIAKGAINLPEPLRLPLLWSYDHNEPIGTCTITDAGDHLHLDMNILKTPKGDDVVKLMTNGKPLVDVGFGYDIKSDSWDGRERTIKEIKLWDISLFAAHPDEDGKR